MACRMRAELFGRAQSKLGELGGFRALSMAIYRIAESGGNTTPSSKGPGPPFVHSTRFGVIRKEDGTAENAWIVGNHSTQMQYLRLAGQVIKQMIVGGSSHEDALRAVVQSKSSDYPTGKRISGLRQMRQIWRMFKRVAHFEAAQRLVRAPATLGELLAASDAIRNWLLTYRKQQRGRREPLLSESELLRVPTAWLPYIPKATLARHEAGTRIVLAPSPDDTGEIDSQVPLLEQEAFIRAACSKHEWSISFPAAGPESLNANQFRRWLAQRDCTFESKRSGSGHVIVRRGDRKSELPMHGGNKQLGKGLIEKITRDLGLR